MKKEGVPKNKRRGYQKIKEGVPKNKKGYQKVKKGYNYLKIFMYKLFMYGSVTLNMLCIDYNIFFVCSQQKE